ncbi:Hypotetical protein [Gulosibacter molinativorax]|nr:Hypotetical protein [Gulosibacter molinativorax]
MNDVIGHLCEDEYDSLDEALEAFKERIRDAELFD